MYFIDFILAFAVLVCKGVGGERPTVARLLLQTNAPPKPLGGKKPDQNRIAILIAGTLPRLKLNTTVQHLVAPLHRDKWKVDVYLSFRMSKVKGWRAATDSFEADPELCDLSKATIQKLLTQRFSMFGGSLIYQHVFDEIDPSPEDLQFIENSTLWQPRVERRSSVRARRARKNLVLMWKELDRLWQHAQAQEHHSGTYSYVMIFREDAYWFQDFHFSTLLEIGGVQRLSGRNVKRNGHLYTMRCDKGHSRGGDMRGLIDYVFLVDRAGANTICNFYSFITQPASHGSSWNEKYLHDLYGFEQYVNSERLYLHLAQHFGLLVTEIPMCLMPMQRVARVKGQLCLHKWCDAEVPIKNLPYFRPEMHLPLCEE